MSEEKDDVRSRILRSAKGLFARQGFDKTTVRQICEEADANVALVSYHFGGKEGVFEAIFDTYFPDHRLDEMPSSTDPATELRYIIQGATSFRLKDREIGAIIQQELALQSPRVDVIERHRGQVWNRLRLILEKGKEEGIFQFASLDTTHLFVIGTLLSDVRMVDAQGASQLAELGIKQFIDDMEIYIFSALHYTGTLQ
ncbi:TetR family transcriptional regulator [Paenibacillus herberti]|uniref:TetR family transcriptional regulator n=1 Tax=Paenibacillus herberti TaxID=1619309 RepID=A0A229NVZ0_9BACL|nr:TetR family transcriptional regulator [Paenibacillus herberti]OXM14047.1 TetR family transcriptional regulator [Paenibacillus herberti]